MRFIANDERVTKWVASRIERIGNKGFGPSVSLGMVDEHKRPVCGVVYHDYQPDSSAVQLSFASDNPRWATRGNFKLLLYHPFVTMGVNKVWALIPHKNERLIKLTHLIGFKREATLRFQFGDQHGVFVSMLGKEYRKRYLN